ncbi:MAG: hypothetical protein ACE5NG_02925 [bacterium]
MNSEFNFPGPPQAGLSHIPMVYVEERLVWEYKQIVRNLAKEKALTEEELNALGADGWELTGVFSDSPFVYFYFKRSAE